jgi:5-methylcytosine-specific restriction protein A
MSTDNPQQRLYLAYDFENLMSLCKQCHGIVHNNKKGE